MKLDDKDHIILGLLRNNSRQSIRELARKTKIRPSTVHQRIQRLIREGVIEKFTLKLNNKAVGESFIVFMLVAGKPTEYIGKSFLGNSEVKEAFGITGEYDLLVKLKFAGVEEFNEFVLNFRKNNKDVAKTVTMIATATLKEEL